MTYLTPTDLNAPPTDHLPEGQRGIVYRIRKESIFQRVAFQAMHPQDGGHPPRQIQGLRKA